MIHTTKSSVLEQMRNTAFSASIAQRLNTQDYSFKAASTSSKSHACWSTSLISFVILHLAETWSMSTAL